MAIHRGIQSAVFYYLSCQPCAEARYRKKLRRDADLGRLEREELSAADPNHYRHPSPSSTNPHWQTEIAAGPHLEARGRKKANNDSSRGLKTSMTQRSNDSNGLSSPDLSSAGGSRDGRHDSKLHFRQFQRDEEMPWDSPSVGRFGSRTTLDSASDIAKPPRARLKGSPTEDEFAPYSVPPISDLHPATVTKLNSREEAMWMMLPPPTADIMEGKTRAPRSRSDSGASSRFSARSGLPLSREVSSRMIERKLRNGEKPQSLAMSRESSSQTSSDPTGQRHDRRFEERDFAGKEAASSGKGKARSPIRVDVSDESNESAITVIRNRDLAPEPLRTQTRKVASKPQLSTILSDSLAGSEVEDETSPGTNASKENIRHSGDSLPDHDRTVRRSSLVNKDDSTKVLRDLAPHSAIFKSHVVSADDLTKISKRDSRHPSQDDHDVQPSPELVDSWYTADFTLPEWIHEHTKREVKSRWSMDI